MAKENTALQGTYFSEGVNGTYYTFHITFADYDTGVIRGRWGKGRFLGHSMGRSGYHRAADGKTTDMTLNFIFEKCVLVATDYKYNRLTGDLVNMFNDEVILSIVFNKSKDQIVSD